MRKLEWQRLKWGNPELYEKLNKSPIEKLFDNGTTPRKREYRTEYPEPKGSDYWKKLDDK
jgi:hypothetical protein